MGAVRISWKILFVVAALILVACELGSERTQPSGASSSTTGSPTAPIAAPPLDCPGDRYETAEADFFGDEPEGTYKGAPTPEAALAEYEVVPSRFSRAAETDPAYTYLRSDDSDVVFIRAEPDGRRTMAVYVRRASGGGWVASAQLKCAE